MPVSEKQLAANRANAARSTGPRTPEGKSRAARNAVKHGFTGSTFAVVRLEDLREIDALKDDLVSVHRPVNAQELFALERMAFAQQAIIRAARLESGLFTTCLNDALDPCENPIFPMTPELAGDGDIKITRAQNRNFALASGFRRMAAESNSWSLFLRYQAQAERQYRRAMDEFERLRALRDPDLPNEPISTPQPERNQSGPADETNPFPIADPTMEGALPAAQATIETQPAPARPVPQLSPDVQPPLAPPAAAASPAPLPERSRGPITAAAIPSAARPRDILDQCVRFSGSCSGQLSSAPRTHGPALCPTA
jgi:hypothetical protein